MQTNEWSLQYSDKVVKYDIPKLGTTEAKRIKRAIETKLKVDPVTFGKPLRYSLTNQRSLRVGNYRIIYSINHDSQQVIIFSIGHRKDIYERS